MRKVHLLVIPFCYKYPHTAVFPMVDSLVEHDNDQYLSILRLTIFA